MRSDIGQKRLWIRTAGCLAVLLLLCVWPGPPAAASSGEGPTLEAVTPLQPLIDDTPEGGTLVLTPGRYTGPVQIGKRLTIEAEEAVLENRSPETAVTVTAAGVRLSGLMVRHFGSGETSALRIEADGVTVERMRISTAGYGIVLRGADRSRIEGNQLRWFVPEGEDSPQRGNGIDLYESHGAVIRDNELMYLRDGIYLENSRDSQVEGNRLFRLRYGIHCMYINGSVIAGNEGEYNFTGAMIMGVTNVTVTDNVFRKQSGNVNAQGILLYDVQTSSIAGNIVEGNRVGLYMEDSGGNVLTDNVIQSNFVGVQFLRSENNRFQRNSFLANVIEAQATDSEANELNGNFWDAFQGLDVTGDGISDLPYAINPFYQRLIARNAAYQLFFQSPGMTFLSDQFVYDQTGWSKDAAPLVRPAAEAPQEPAGSPGSVMVAGWLLLFASTITIIYLGVMRS